jgi:DNA (cytosine-5)-methyltransferase 1
VRVFFNVFWDWWLRGGHYRSAVPGAECIGYSEIDEHAIKTYERQFDGHTNYGDATGIDSARAPRLSTYSWADFLARLSALLETEADLMTPEAHSSLMSLGFSKTKDHHIWFSKTLKVYLVTTAEKLSQVILGVLTELGYHVEWKILNSKYFGVPQNRERIYIVGHLGGFSGRKVFPFPTDDKTLEEIWNQNNHSRRNSSDHQSTDGGGHRTTRGISSFRCQLFQRY